MVPPSRVALVIILSMQIILHRLNWCFTSCWCQKSKYFLFFSLFPLSLPFSFEGAWRAVAHGACGVLNFVLNRPFIAAKFSLRAPNKLPHYPSQSITLLRTNYHSEYHTTSTKYYPMYLHQSIARAPTNTTNCTGRKSNSRGSGGRNRKGGDIAGEGEAVVGLRAPAHSFLLLLLLLFLGSPANCSLGCHAVLLTASLTVLVYIQSCRDFVFSDSWRKWETITGI